MDLVRIILRKVPGVYDVIKFQAEKRVYGVVLSVDLALAYGYNAQDVLRASQERIGRYVEEYSSINMVAVDVRAKRLVHAGSSNSDTGEIAT